mgnify:CR=1 FL=1
MYKVVRNKHISIWFENCYKLPPRIYNMISHDKKIKKKEIWEVRDGIIQSVKSKKQSV